MHPLISVIIPTFNRRDTIKRSIDSVLSQDYDNIELIIVDDNSTDNTKEIVESYGYDRIKYYFNTDINLKPKKNEEQEWLEISELIWQMES